MSLRPVSAVYAGVLHAGGRPRSGAPSVPRALGSLLTWVFLLTGGVWCVVEILAG